MSGRNIYTGQDADAETRVFDTTDMELGYSMYYESVYSRFFELTGLGNKRGRGKKILEVGCGSGEWGRRLAKMGYKVTGIDLSKALVKAANHLAKKEKLDYRAYARNVFNYRGKNFDIVLCAGILHHFEDLSPIINKLRDFLGKNKEVIIIEPNGSNIMIKITEYIRKNFWPFNKMRKLGTLNETNHSAEKYAEEFKKARFTPGFSGGFNAKARFGDYGFVTNLLLRVKYFLQDITTIFMKPTTRGTVIVMKFKK